MTQVDFYTAGSRGTLGLMRFSGNSGSTWSAPGAFAGTEPRLRLSIAVDIETHVRVSDGWCFFYLFLVVSVEPFCDGCRPVNVLVLTASEKRRCLVCSATVPKFIRDFLFPSHPSPTSELLCRPDCLSHSLFSIQLPTTTRRTTRRLF